MKKIADFFQKKETLIVAVVLVLAALLRLFDLTAWSLTNDELSGLRRTLYSSLADVIRYGVMEGDTHPAGVEVFLYYWTKFFGMSEFAVRFPFFVCGIISLALIFLIAKDWFGKTSALLSLTIASVSSFFILYAQLARPYAPGLLFTLLSVWLITRIIQSSKNNPLLIVATSLSIAATGYIHYFALLTTAVAGIALLFTAQKKKLLVLLLTYTLAFLIFVPHLKITLYQYSFGFENVSWIPFPEPYWLAFFFYHITNYSLLFLILLICLPLILLIIRTSSIKAKNYRIIALLIFFIPYLAAHIFSVLKTPLLQDSILLFGLPFLLFFFTSFFETSVKRLIPLLIVLIITGSITHLLSKEQYRKGLGDFKTLASEIAEKIGQYGGTDSCSCIANINSPFYLDYYFKKNHQNIRCDMYRIHGDTGLMKLKTVIEKNTKPYIILAEMGDYNLRHSPYIIQNHFPSLVEKTKNKEIHISVFSKKTVLSEQDNNKIGEWLYNFDNPAEANVDTATFFTGRGSLRMPSSIEFSPDLRIPIHDIKFNTDSVYFEIECWVKSPKETKAVLVGNIIDCKESWQGWDLKYFSKDTGWYKAVMSYYPKDYKCNIKELQFYVWNPGKEVLWIDDYRIKLYKRNK